MNFSLTFILLQMKAFYDPRKEEFKKVFGERAPSLEIVFANAEKHVKEGDRITNKFRGLLNKSFVVGDSSSSEEN